MEIELTISLPHGGSTICGASNLDELQQKFQYYKKYYETECNYIGVEYRAQELCLICHGAGKIRSKKRFTEKECKSCNGKGIVREIQIETEGKENA